MNSLVTSQPSGESCARPPELQCRGFKQRAGKSACDGGVTGDMSLLYNNQACVWGYLGLAKKVWTHVFARTRPERGHGSWSALLPWKIVDQNQLFGTQWSNL